MGELKKKALDNQRFKQNSFCKGAIFFEEYEAKNRIHVVNVGNILCQP